MTPLYSRLLYRGIYVTFLILQSNSTPSIAKAADEGMVEGLAWWVSAENQGDVGGKLRRLSCVVWSTYQHLSNHFGAEFFINIVVDAWLVTGTVRCSGVQDAHRDLRPCLRVDCSFWCDRSMQKWIVSITPELFHIWAHALSRRWTGTIIWKVDPVMRCDESGCLLVVHHRKKASFPPLPWKTLLSGSKYDVFPSEVSER